jgi:hypothetical protein
MEADFKWSAEQKARVQPGMTIQSHSPMMRGRQRIIEAELFFVRVEDDDIFDSLIPWGYCDPESLEGR